MTNNNKQALLTSAEIVRLRRYLGTCLPNAVDVDDLMQDVFVCLLRNDPPERIENLRAYLFTIAKRQLHQRAKRVAQAVCVSTSELVDEVEPEIVDDLFEALDARQCIEAMSSEPKKISPRAWETLVMYRGEGRTFKEIAKQFGVSATMARKYLLKADEYCDERRQAFLGP